MKNITLKLKVLLKMIFVLCLGFSMACGKQFEERQKQLNKKYEANSFESNTYKDGLTVSGTVEQVSTEFIRKKGETYMLFFGFRPTTDNIVEFEQILMNDFDGEIEIFQKGKPYFIINYHDYDAFTWSPSRDTYGPAYYLIIDSNDTNYSFKPKIRAKDAYTYSFSLKRIKTNNVRKHNTTKNPNPENETINVPVVMNRIDMELENKGRHIFTFGLHFPTIFDSDGKRAYTKEPAIFDDIIQNEYDGSIKVYKNGKPYLVMRFDDVVNGSGWSGWWGGHDDESGHVKTYNFFIGEPSIYSFIPEIVSKSNFEFSLSINYVHVRKHL